MIAVMDMWGTRACAAGLYLAAGAVIVWMMWAQSGAQEWPRLVVRRGVVAADMLVGAALVVQGIAAADRRRRVLVGVGLAIVCVGAVTALVWIQG